jgi:SAM-dependent methyltransferase
MLLENPISYDSTDCFACGSILSTVVYEYTTHLIFGSEKYPVNSTLNLCTTCGLVLNNPRLSEKTLQWLYGTWYGADTALYGSGELEQMNTARLSFIKKYAALPGKVIDIGCGGASFLSLLKSEAVEVYGVEPSRDLREYAKSKYDINIFDGEMDANFVAEHEGRYDLVTFNEVLEHVYNPIDFLTLAARLTSNLLYFDVPDSLRPRFANIADFFGIEHLNHFTSFSIERVANSLGLEVVAMEPDETHPILKVLLRKSISKESISGIANEVSIVEESFRKYKSDRAVFLSGLKSNFAGITDIVIYGAGRHTIQMIESGLLEGITIRGVVDSNPEKHGVSFLDTKIEEPSMLAESQYPVVISSFDSQDDISTFLTNNFPQVTQIRLYKH